MISAPWAMAVGSLACLVVAIVWPGLAGTILFALLVALALGFVGFHAARAALPARQLHDESTPFDRGPLRAAAPHAREVIRRLAAQVSAFADPDDARRVPIPSGAHRTLALEVTRRLSERHGLDLERVEDHPRIREVLDSAAWRLVSAPADGRASWAFREPVYLDELEGILDQVEQL